MRDQGTRVGGTDEFLSRMQREEEIRRGQLWRRWWEQGAPMETVVVPARSTDPHAFDYEWHFANHDPGDEDRS